MSQLITMGIFGGTFDPVHNGHLRLALELKQHLKLDEMRLLPCHRPPHREKPVLSSKHRVAMLRLALVQCQQLSIDERELQRPTLSYTLDTLIEMRNELGDRVSLCLAMGMDSLVSLPAWHRWQELLNFTHLIVAARPGWQAPVSGEVFNLLNQHRAEASVLAQRSCGSIVIEQLSLLPISASVIRAQIARGESPQFLLPDSVWNYICENRLYGIDD